MKKIRKIILAAILILFSLTVLLSGLAIFIANRYEKEINGYFLSYLNNRLKTEVKISGMEFSLLKNFPFAGVTLNNIFIRSALRKQDTLLSAEHLSLSFRLPDVFRKNFSVRKVQITGGALKIIISEKNRKSYDTWKVDTATHDQVRFNLASLLLEDVRMIYEYRPGKLLADAMISKGLLTGILVGSTQEIDMHISGKMNRLSAEGSDYITGKNITLAAHLTSQDDIFRFQDGMIQSDDYRFDFAGTCNLSGSKTTTDLTITFNKFDLAKLKKNIPAEYLKPLKKYSFSGNAEMKIKIKGVISEKILPSVRIDFTIRNGRCTIILDRSTELSVGHVLTEASGYPTDSHINIPQLSGVFTASDLRKNSSMKIAVSSISAVSGKSRGSGNFTISNFENPFAKINGEIRLSTDDFPFRLSDTMEIRSGHIVFNGEYAGPLKVTGKWGKQDGESIQLSGNGEISFDKITGQHSSLPFSNVKSRFHLSNDTAIIEELSYSIGGGDHFFKGMIGHFPECMLVDGAKVPVTGSFRTDLLDLNMIFGEDKNSAGSSFRFMLPQWLETDIRFDIGLITFRRFEAGNLNGRMVKTGQKIIVNPVSFKAMEGTASGKWLLDGSSGNDWILSCDADLQQINIQKLFYAMENFGQEYITSNHLKGMVTAKVEFASAWDQQMNIIPQKIFTTADIVIAQGELIDFKPLEQLSEYIALSELKKVKFSTLQNRIEIRERKIFIPEMEVKSSAMNLTVSGVHTFDNNIDYKIKVKMSEVTAKKAKKAKKENEEFGIEEAGDGGMTLFLSMTGTVDNPVMKYDKKAAFVKMKEGLKEEKQELKTILHEEFGLFKKDSSLKKPVQKEKPKDPFIYEWE